MFCSQTCQEQGDGSPTLPRAIGPCKLVHCTPDLESHLISIARVSNPANQSNPNGTALIRYMLRKAHWSPFEMVNLCIEVNCPRDIGRQLLRHWTLRPQEFSQRYAEPGALPATGLREARIQDPKNRQNSLPCTDPLLIEWWEGAQKRIIREANFIYEMALSQGIAKEVARAVLPEGLTATRLYFNGNLRSWLHFCALRLDPEQGTQKETKEIAQSCWDILCKAAPQTTQAWLALKETKNV